MRQVLQSEAAAAGIHPDRLLFAPIVDKTAHLSRLIFVDLFLDTLFYNAHTTAADALWMHVPIITFAGSTFASRVAGSLITHLSEPDFTSILITHSVKEFEAVAVDIASPDQNQARFIALNLHLTRGTLFGSTFNTQATTSHLEASYQIMWDLTQGGTIPSPYHAMVLKKESTKRVISQSKRIEQYLSIIQSHFVASQWEIARAGYHRLVTADPTCVYALHNLGVTELKLGHVHRSNILMFETLRAENEVWYAAAVLSRLPGGGKVLNRDNKPTIVIFCHQYGGSYWPFWGPSSLKSSDKKNAQNGVG